MRSMFEKKEQYCSTLLILQFSNESNLIGRLPYEVTQL